MRIAHDRTEDAILSRPIRSDVDFRSGRRRCSRAESQDRTTRFTPNSCAAMVLGKSTRKQCHTAFQRPAFYRRIADGDPMYYHID